MAQTIDFSTGTRTKFTYDLANRLVSQKEYTGTGANGGTLRSSTDFTYADKTNYWTQGDGSFVFTRKTGDGSLS